MKMIRAQHQGLTPEEREDGELPADTMLEMLLHGSRSASWTQKHGHRCVSSKTFGTIPSQRVNQIGYLEDPDAIRGRTRSWPNWIERPFIGQSADNHDDGGLYCKKEACAAENAKVVPINMVLYRIPLYLVVSHGFENVGEQHPLCPLGDSSTRWYHRHHLPNCFRCYLVAPFQRPSSDCRKLHTFCTLLPPHLFHQAGLPTSSRLVLDLYRP